MKVLKAAWSKGECSDGTACLGQCAGDGVRAADADVNDAGRGAHKKVSASSPRGTGLAVTEGG
eukprot:4524641-Pyramimonas_sp.AAC.1